MIISKTLENAINTGNVIGIRSALYTIAHEDPGFSTGKFIETLQYVDKKNIIGLYDEYDGEIFAPETEWNEEYWALVASEMVDNFCHERINHLIEIGKHVYPKSIKKSGSASVQLTIDNSKKEYQSSYIPKYQKKSAGKLGLKEALHRHIDKKTDWEKRREVAEERFQSEGYRKNGESYRNFTNHN